MVTTYLSGGRSSGLSAALSAVSIAPKIVVGVGTGSEGQDEMEKS